MEVGKRIRFAREEARLTQAQLACFDGGLETECRTAYDIHVWRSACLMSG